MSVHDSALTSSVKTQSRYSQRLSWITAWALRRRNEVLFLLAVCLLALPAQAGESLMPVASRTIYPRDVIVADMLDERAVALRNGTAGAYVENKADIIGKVARQTLLKGALIPAYAVEAAKLVTNGGQVRIVFRANGLVIVAYGAAMQDGTAGELVRVRNSDSGLIISGTVQADGSILVGEG